MTTYTQDTCIRPNQSGLGTGSDGNSYTQVRGNQLLSILSNQGDITYNGNTTLGILLYSSLSEAATEISANIEDTGSSGIIGLILRYVDNSNFYYCDLGNIAGNLEIGACIAGTFTNLANFAFSASSNTLYTIKFNATGTTLEAKVWLAGNSEPGWQITHTDTNFSSGRFGVTAAPGASSSCLFDHLLVTDGSTTVTQSFSETTTVIESFALNDSFSSSDLAAQTESYGITGAATFIDAQLNTEIASLTGAVTSLDAQANTEQYSLSGAAAGSDQAAYTEQYSLAAILSQAEAQGLVESWLLSDQAAGSEQNPTGESFSLVGAGLPSEQITLLEQFALLDNLSQSEVTQVIESWYSGPPSTALPMLVTWRGRSGKTTWRGRSGKVTWKAR